MVEFPLRVRIRVSNWNEFVSELRNKLRREKVQVGIDIDEREMERQIRRGLEMLFREPITAKIGRMIQTASERLEGWFGGGGGRRGIRGALEKFLGERAPIILSIFAIIEIAKNIFNAVMDIARRGARFSGYMQATLKLLDLMFSLALKPIADVVGMILKPVLLALLKYVIIPWSKITSPQNTKYWEEFSKAVSRYMGMGMPMPMAMFTGAIEMAVRSHIEDFKKEGEENAKKYGDVLRNVNESYLNAGQKQAIMYDGALMRIVGDWESKGKEGAGSYSRKLHDVVAEFGIGGLGAAALFGDVLKKFNVSIDDSTRKTSQSMSTTASIFNGLVSGRSAPVPTIADIFVGAAKMLINAYNEMKRQISSFASGIMSAIGNMASGAMSMISGATEYTIDTGYELGGYEWSYHVNKVAGWVAGLQIGGLIRKTGLYLLHAGEVVIPSWRMGELGARTISNVFEINIKVDVDKIASDLDIRRLADKLAKEIVRSIERRGRM